MLGLQGNTSSSKVYRCVACSATFTGLASLLVHQATHAGALDKHPVHPPKELSSTHHGTALSKPQPNPSTSLPESPAPSLFICDCGDEFQDFNLMLEHKSSHVSVPLNSDTVYSIEEQCEEVSAAQHESYRSSLTQPVLALNYPPIPHGITVPVLDSSLLDSKVDVGIKGGVTVVTTPQDQSKTPQDPSEKRFCPPSGDLPGEISTTQEPLLQAIQESSPKDKNDSIPSNTISQADNLPKSRTLMKMLATAYMKRFQPPQSPKTSTKSVLPKTEVIPVEIVETQTKSDASPNTNPSVGQLRRLLTKPGLKTKSPGVGRILDSSSKSIVSLTRTFSPVVVLETRQKLFDFGNDGKEGRYQCGRCRRVFQDLDNLTEHHSLHRKERIKCCRHCKQLIIGKPPFPENHICPQLLVKTTQQSNSLGSKFSSGEKMRPFHNLKQQGYLNNNAKRVFYCPLCKHSYARRYNLKMHKCQGAGSSLPLHATTSIQKKLRSSSKSNSTAADISEAAESSRNIAVGTEAANIKIENMVWSGTPKSFLPFCLKESMLEDHEDATQSKTSLQQEEKAAAVCPEENGGQWTMPLDDDVEVPSDAEDTDNDAELKEPISGGHTAQNTSLPFFIRDGVKRYPCNRCQKTYSRQSTLRRHLRLCGFRPHGFGTIPQNTSKVRPMLGTMPLHPPKVKPMFDCFVCGRSFNRKDNMLVHRKKCQLNRTMASTEGGLMQQSFSGSASEGQSQLDNEGNWGIMSLPSVLPRRVTCECGAGFTSPRLLLEHLQKHAQESYTCPTCGETVSSWADYEVHLQLHMHPHHQLYKGLQPQRSQPLLLRFQQQPPQQQPSQPGCRFPSKQPSAVQHRPPLKQPSAVHLPNPNMKQQRIPCTRCNNTFSSRASLRKHITMNRCKGGRVANLPKTNHCSRCNTDFQNVMSLVFHQRSGNCKPAFKPMRCPACVRWFSTMDGLQKHLLTHNQSESYRCDVCQGMYRNLKSLKNHRRKVHRIMAGNSMPRTKQEKVDS